MNVICILGGWLLLWEKSKRDCGEGEGGSVKKEGKIFFPAPPRIPAPRHPHPNALFLPLFPPIFPPRGLPPFSLPQDTKAAIAA